MSKHGYAKQNVELLNDQFLKIQYDISRLDERVAVLEKQVNKNQAQKRAEISIA